MSYLFAIILSFNLLPASAEATVQSRLSDQTFACEAYSSFLNPDVLSALKSSAIPDRREFPVNPDIKPCDDFYAYTCSKVMDTFKLREDRTKHTFSFSDSSERLLEQKKSYLKDLSRQPKKSKGEKELSDVFLACLNTDQRAEDEQTKVKTLKEELYALKDKKTFLEYVSSRYLKNKYSFMWFGDVVNQDNPDINDIVFGFDVRNLPERSYYEDKKVTRAYKKLVGSFFKNLGYRDFDAKSEALVNFEIGFDKIYPTPQEWRVIWTQKNYASRKKLLKDYKNLNLKTYFSNIPKKTAVRFNTPKTFEYMNAYFKKESLENIKAVFLYNALSSLMDEGYKDFYKEKFAFNKKYLGGANKRPALTERCTKYVMSSFSKELDFELFSKVFKGFSKPKFVALAEKVRSALLEEIKENTWLSKESKKNALKKMKTAKLNLVKPESKKEWDLLETANYSPLHYLSNNDLRGELRVKRSLKLLKTGPNKVAWFSGPLTVNAYYYQRRNAFYMLAGILQYPFYDQELPEHIGLGSIGMVVGHELGHGIDDKGSKYDSKGRLRQWMSEEDLKKFEKRSSRLVKQFDDAGNNGTLTLGENIGDLVGLTASYRAAFGDGSKTPKKKKQEFFTQYGRSWCGVIRPEAKKKLIKTDSHASMELRVNEQVKHQKGFHEAFGCKAGDKMFLSEEDRVKIW
jgi:putative endopeptidase